MTNQHNLASYSDVNIAFDAGFDKGWRSGARFVGRVAGRFQPKPSAPADKPSAPHKLNGHAQHTTANGNDRDSPMLPL